MKPNDQDNQTDPFHKVLKEWRTDAPVPPLFQQHVWRRIEGTQAAPSVWATVTHWIGAVLPRPALAASYVAVLLTLGVTAGWAQARHETARVRDELGQHYVRALNPYQAPRQ